MVEQTLKIEDVYLDGIERTESVQPTKLFIQSRDKRIHISHFMFPAIKVIQHFDHIAAFPFGHFTQPSAKHRPASVAAVVAENRFHLLQNGVPALFRDNVKRFWSMESASSAMLQDVSSQRDSCLSLLKGNATLPHIQNMGRAFTDFSSDPISFNAIILWVTSNILSASLATSRNLELTALDDSELSIRDDFVDWISGGGGGSGLGHERSGVCWPSDVFGHWETSVDGGLSHFCLVEKRGLDRK
nr:hypothetical protein Iba_chr08dCG2300 [Ipomoea batatas]